MSNYQKKVDIQTSLLEELYNNPRLPGSLDIGAKVRNVLSAVIKKSPLSRHLIAGKMSELVDKDITKAMIDSWTADSKDAWRFPAEYIPAFCIAAGDTTLLSILCNECSCMCIKTKDQITLELGQIAAQELVLRERKRKLLLQSEGAQDD